MNFENDFKLVESVFVHFLWQRIVFIPSPHRHSTGYKWKSAFKCVVISVIFIYSIIVCRTERSERRQKMPRWFACAYPIPNRYVCLRSGKFNCLFIETNERHFWNLMIINMHYNKVDPFFRCIELQPGHSKLASTFFFRTQPKNASTDAN